MYSAVHLLQRPALIIIDACQTEGRNPRAPPAPANAFPLHAGTAGTVLNFSVYGMLLTEAAYGQTHAGMFQMQAVQPQFAPLHSAERQKSIPAEDSNHQYGNHR